MFEFAAKRQTQAELLDDTKRLYWQSLPATLPFAFAGSIVTLLPGLLVSGQSAFIMNMVLIWLSTALAALFNALIAQHMYTSTHQQTLISRGESWRLLESKLNRVLISSLVYYGIVLCTFMLLILPGIFFAVLLVMYLPCLIEKTDPTVALFKRSIRLVLNHWWRTLTVVFLVPVLVGSISYLIEGRLWGHQSFFAVIFSLLTSTVFITPWTLSAILVQHHDLKLRAA